MKRFVFAVLTAILIPALSGTPALAGKIGITGSTTVQPIAEMIGAAFQKDHPGTTVTVTGGGSGNGIKAIIDGSTDIGNASRFIKTKEVAYAKEKGVYPVPFCIAYDCIAAVVHPSNPVANLTTAQLKAVYEGRTANWKDLGGRDAPIVLVSRDHSSGTYEVWNEKIMDGAAVHPSASLVDSNESALELVAKSPNAIGYIGHGYLDRTVKALTVNGVTSEAKNALNGRYPISRSLYMFTQGWPSGDTLSFLNYVLNPNKGQILVNKAGFVSLYPPTSGRPATPALNTSDVTIPPAVLPLVKKAQTLLAAAGFAPGPVDGIAGAKTRAAVAAFQKSRGMKPDGRITPQLIRALETAAKK